MLTNIHCRNAQPSKKPYKLFDGNGLFLLVSPGGTRKPAGLKHWRIKYRFAGKEKSLSLGIYPQVSLAEARKRTVKTRELLAQGIDPSAQRRQEKQLAELKAQNTFKALAHEWWEAKHDGWSSSHSKATLNLLEKQLFPRLGDRPIAEIEAPDLLETIRVIERRGALEIAKKALGVAGQVFRYAIGEGKAKHDSSYRLVGQLKSREVQHYNALKEADLPEFLKKLESYDGNTITRHAIRLLMLTFVRTNELRGAQWTEFDFNKSEWRIPAERMKMGVEHIVPLSRQVLSVLEELRTLTVHREHVFPNEHHPKKWMSENTILFALYRMGYRGKATGHGFRTTASTILNESGKWKPDAIERQLAHGERNKVRAAYNKAEYLSERRKMMQWWADRLDILVSDANVVQLRKLA